MNQSGFVCTKKYGNQRLLVNAFFGEEFEEDCVEVFFQVNGAVVLVEEDDLDSINVSASREQTLIIFRVYETMMAFFIECYRDGKIVYQKSSHDNETIIQSGNLGSLQNAVLETSSLFNKILQDTGISVWDAL
jgi:hypothetical protein